MKDLGYAPRTQHFLSSTLSLAGGLILIAGPTGSGKSTSLYSMLASPKLAGKNIYSLEDPVEALVGNVSQTAVGETAGITYEQGLKALLRQDPDVIMIGELRDAATAALAAEAALTGHLILATVHAGSALEVILRMLEFKVSPQILGQVLRAVVFQRLVPVLCRTCRPTPAAALRNAPVSHETGLCRSCNGSGYDGRALVAESVLPSDTIVRKLASGAALPDCVSDLSPENYDSPHDTLDRLLMSGSISQLDYQRFPFPSYLREFSAVPPECVHAGSQPEA